MHTSTVARLSVTAGCWCAMLSALPARGHPMPSNLSRKRLFMADGALHLAHMEGGRGPTQPLMYRVLAKRLQLATPS